MRTRGDSRACRRRSPSRSTPSRLCPPRLNSCGCAGLNRSCRFSICVRICVASVSARLRSAADSVFSISCKRGHVEPGPAAGVAFLADRPLPNSRRRRARTRTAARDRFSIPSGEYSCDQPLRGGQVIERHRLLQPPLHRRDVDIAAAAVFGELRELPGSLVAAQLVRARERFARRGAIAGGQGEIGSVGCRPARRRARARPSVRRASG